MTYAVAVGQVWGSEEYSSTQTFTPPMAKPRSRLLLPCDKVIQTQTDRPRAKHGLSLQLVSQLEKEVEQLVRKLLTVVPADPSAHSHALYTWITHNVHFDTRAYKRGRMLDTRHDAGLCAFHKRKALSSGFADLFQVMCSFAGIECARIQGFLKDLCYLPGDPVHDVINHEWNAVRVQGHWKLVDVTLGSGYLAANKVFIQHFSSIHFFTDPSELIHTHLPKNPRWQLLTIPKSAGEFERETVYFGGFFEHDVISCDQPWAVLHTKDSVSIQLTAYCPLIYHYTLHDVRRKNEFSGCVSYSYNALHTCFTVRPPFGGFFQFVISGKAVYAPGLMVPLLSYMIVCPEVVVEVQPFLLEQPDVTWGMTPYFEQYDMIPVNGFATHIISKDGAGQISMGRVHREASEFEVCGVLICCSECECSIRDDIQIITEECNRNDEATDGFVRSSGEAMNDVSCSFTKYTLSFLCPHDGTFQLQVLGRLHQDSALVCISQHYVINHSL